MVRTEPSGRRGTHVEGLQPLGLHAVRLGHLLGVVVVLVLVLVLVAPVQGQVLGPPLSALVLAGVVAGVAVCRGLQREQRRWPVTFAAHT